MVNVSGQMGVPVIVIDGEIIVGFNRPRIQELVSGGGAKATRFGLKIADALKAAPQMGQKPVPGAIIGEVEPGLLGEKAGLQPADIVTEVSGSKVGSAADMERVLAGVKPGDIVTVLFLRAGESRKSEIVV
jgi:serine protease Do